MFFLALMVIGGCLTSVGGGKFLLVPPPAVSTCLETMSIGEELLKRGHQVHLFAPLIDTKSCVSRWQTERFGSKFKILNPTMDPSFQKTHNEFTTHAQKSMFGSASMMSILANASSMMTTLCTAMYQDQNLLHQMLAEKYDLALIQAVPFSSCSFAISVYLDVPSAAVSSFIDPLDSHMPLQSNIFPGIFTTFTNEMHFGQRLLNTLLSFATPLIWYVIRPQLDLSQYSEKLRGLNMRNLVKDSILFIENSDYVIDYPKAVFPNFIQAGGLTAGPAKPLPADLKDFMDKAKSGVIVISFGSVLKHAPAYIMENTRAAASRFKMMVLLKHDKDEMRGNIKTMSWIPQNDVLGHPNTKLFISHCGKNGFWEGVYHGVPIICAPFNGDAYNTAAKVKHYKVGSSFNLRTASVDEIAGHIEFVLNKSSAHENMKRISTLMRDRPETAAQRAASAVEHVVKYGGAHMRPPSVDQCFTTYIYADVWFTIFAVSVLVVCVDIWVMRWCCCKSKTKTKKKKTE